jgi:hypothetical protein
MSSCGRCFPLLLPGGLALQPLLGCCLLLLEPACSTVQAELESGQVSNLYEHVACALLAKLPVATCMNFQARYFCAFSCCNSVDVEYAASCSCGPAA